MHSTARSGSAALFSLLLSFGLLSAGGCKSDDDGGDGSGGSSSGGSSGSSGGSTSVGGGNSTGRPPATALSANEYSWDGSWEPAASEFPLPGLLDTDPTQQGLPPGHWGWDNSCNCPGNEGLAIYNNEFVAKGLDFEQLLDSQDRLFGWRLIDTDGGTTDLNQRGDNYDGSDGVDLWDLTTLQGTGPSDKSNGINFGEGPDMLRYQTGYSVDMRTGSDDRGALFDNDLVILGSENKLGYDEYDINGTTIHTGPGSDLVFAQNFGPAALDLGLGASGRTDTLDPNDGDDMAILSGNMRDFRVYGGSGDDVFVWYVDDVLDTRFLGPSFYGGGGWGDAIWADDGVDRLIMAVAADTEVVSKRSEHDNNPGSFLCFVYSDYNVSVDTPTEDDEFARYYGISPIGPNNEHTVTASYRSPDGVVFTQDFYLIDIEEVQLGTGEDAKVYSVDQVTGILTLDSSLDPITALPSRADFNQLFDTFGK